MGTDERSRKGTLVGITKRSRLRGIPGGGAYSASKAAHHLQESLRVELKKSGCLGRYHLPRLHPHTDDGGEQIQDAVLIGVDDAVERFARHRLQTSFTVIPGPWVSTAARIAGVAELAARRAVSADAEEAAEGIETG